MISLSALLLFVVSLACSLYAQPPVAAADEKEKINFQDICWSPDGEVIYFSAMKVKSDYSDYSKEKWNIYKYDFSTHITSNFIDSALYVAVSPSGEQLAAGKIKTGNRDLYLYDKEGRELRRLTTDAADDFGATFSPDGKLLAFNSRRSGKPEIYVVNADGGALKQLTYSDGFSSYNPSWSPDGRLIAYYLEKGDRKDQIYVMDADGSNATNISRDTFNNFFPSWKDVNRILYTRHADGQMVPVTTDSRGSTKTVLSGIHSFYCRYSPDGKLLAYIDDEAACIQVINLERGEHVASIFVE